MKKLVNTIQKLVKDTTFEVLAVALLLVIPLYPKFPFISVPGTYVSIRLEDFLLFATLILLGLHFLRIKAKFGKTEKAVGLYLAVGLLSVTSAAFLTKTVSPHIALFHLLRRLEYFVPFFLGLVVMMKKTKNKLNFFLNTILVVIFVSFIYGVGQRYLAFPVIITQNLEYAKGIALRWIPGSHINASFAGHYDLATFLVLTLPLIVSLFFVVGRRTTKLILALAFFASLWLLANAISRISIVSYLVASSVALILLNKKKAILLVLVASLSFFALSSDLLVRYGQIFEVVRRRVSIEKSVEVLAAEEQATENQSSLAVFEDRSTSIRLNVEWPRAVRAFSKNPLLGTGYASITLATDNDFLRALGETGIVGFLAFSLVFLSLFSELSRVKMSKLKGVKKAFMAGYIGALPGVFLNAFFIDVFEASKFATMFWLLTGLAVGLSRNGEN